MIKLFRNYALITMVQLAGFFVMMYSVGVLGEKLRYDLRGKLFNHLQSFHCPISPNAFGLDHVARNF